MSTRSCRFTVIALLFAVCLAASVPAPAAAEPGGETGAMRLELQPGSWINSEPLTLASLTGKVVLVDFWDYTCINCLRTLPYLQAWHQRYAPLGLILIGVHTPEFPFARSYDHVRQATERLGVTWPVLVDSDYRTWEAFGNRYWPHHYLFAAGGRLVYDHIGEGNYERTEREIQRALTAAGVTASFPAPLEPVRETDRPNAVCYRVTPEVYLGYQRGRLGNPEGLRPEQTVVFHLPEQLRPHLFYLAGRWQIGAHAVTAAAHPEDNTLLLSYRVTSVNLVLEPPAAGPARLTLTLDGAGFPRECAGTDVRFTEEGEAFVVVDQPRMYELVNSPLWGEHVLRVRCETPGLAAYAFTFGTSCMAPPD